MKWACGRSWNSRLRDMDADTHLHVSFDVDFLDPEIAPGVGTTVAGGLSYREAQLCMEMIADTGPLASLDIMELNPALDVRNKTAAAGGRSGRIAVRQEHADAQTAGIPRALLSILDGHFPKDLPWPPT